jgi:hypothetical protein
MRPRDSLNLAFDLINQTVTACYDGNAGIRVLGPLLVAEQELRTELGPEAIKAYAGAKAPAHVGARASSRFITFIDALEQQCLRAYASAAPSINRLLSALWRDDGGASRLAPGAAVAAAAFAGCIALTTLSLQPREETQVDVANAQAELDQVTAPSAETSDKTVGFVIEAVATPEPRSARRVARPKPAHEEPLGVAYASVAPEAIQESEEVVVTPSAGPVWARVPNARRLAALYPYSALEQGGEGEAQLHCMVLDGGELDCARVEETSRSSGDAAMRVSRTLRHTRWRADGSSAVGSPVNLRVIFRLEGQERRDAV